MTQSQASIRVEQGDITRYTTDAIVNAANGQLSPGGGVCGAIHRAAGPQLAMASQAKGPCDTGDARITPGFELPAGYVIHAVGPVWHGGNQNEADALRAAYRNSLDLAAQTKLASIAFPALSCGVFGYPIDQAAQLAADAVCGWAEGPGNGSSVREIIFVCFGHDTLGPFRKAVANRAG